MKIIIDEIPMDLNAVKLLARVAETRSFTQAAVSLGLTQSGLSRAIGRLEAELGVRLLHRTTRSVSLTPDGQLFYERWPPRCRPIATTRSPSIPLASIPTPNCWKPSARSRPTPVPACA